MSKHLLVAISGAFAFPDLIVHDPLDCTFATNQRTVITAGSYLFQDLLFQDPSLQLINFDFLIHANAGCSDLPSFHEKNGAARLGFRSINHGNQIRLSGKIMKSDWSNQLILQIPSSDCTYELVQASIAFELSLKRCRLGQRLNIDKEESDEALMREQLIDSPDVEEFDEALLRGNLIDSPDDFKPVVQLPKSVKGMLLIDGVLNFAEYYSIFVRLPDQKQDEYRFPLRQINFSFSRARWFSTGDLSKRSEAKSAVNSLCRYLNQYISDPKEALDSATVSIHEFIIKWVKNSPEKNGGLSTDRENVDRLLPNTVSGLSLIQGLHRYVRDHYHEQWNMYRSPDKRNYRSAYNVIRSAYTIAEPFIAGDLKVMANAEATAEAMCRYLNSRIPDQDRKVDFRSVPINVFLMR